MSIVIVQGPVSGKGSTVSFPANTTAGNCVVVGFSDVAGASSTTGATLGGAAGNFAKLVEAHNASGTHNLASLWADPGCAGGQKAVAVTASGITDATIWAIEVGGLAAASVGDVSHPATGTAGGWSSGAAGPTAQPSELAVGVCSNGTSGTAGPAAPWANTTVTSNSLGVVDVYGYQILSSAGTITYAGTGGSTANGWAAVVATLKASGGGPAVNSGAFLAFFP